MNKNNVLVTGSNSGFGRLISLALARRGHTVFATMRSPSTKNASAAAGLRGVEVSIVQPGVFKTGIVTSTVVGADAERAQGYGLEAVSAKLQGMIAAMHDGPGASDPEEVARAVVALVEAPPGTRPLRVVVDPSGGGAGTEALNKVAGEIQRGLLTALGMSQMVD